MKKTAIGAILVTILLVLILYLLKGNHALQAFQDWLNNNGLATILAILIPTGIYLAVFLWNKRKEETPEYIKHEELLLSEVHKLEEIQTVSYREQSLMNHWKNKYDELTFHGWTAKYADNSIIVWSCLEKSEIAGYLEKHLKNSKLQALLNEWKLAMEKDLSARQFLFYSIGNSVKEFIKIPLLQYEWGKEYTKPYATDYYAAAIYDDVFCSLVGNPIQNKKTYLRHEESGKITWNYGGNNWLLLSSDDAKQQADAIDLLLTLESNSINLPEAEKAKDAYFEAIDKTRQLKTMVKITTNLPRGKRCDYCKRL